MKKQVWKETKEFIVDALPELIGMGVTIVVSLIGTAVGTWIAWKAGWIR